MHPVALLLFDLRLQIMQNKPRKEACQSHRGGRAVSQAVKHRHRAGVIVQHALVGACAAALVRRRRSAFEKLCREVAHIACWRMRKSRRSS